MKDLPWSLRTTMAPLGRKGRGDAKQIRDAGGIQALHICPATGNAPTRMTRASWEVLCAATQRRSRERECIDKNQAQLMRMTRRLNVCSWCQGKTLPRGLEFIDAAEMAEMIKPKEEAMAKQSKLGICENCGDKGALTGSFGKRVCATCLKIRSGVNSHVEKVATAARQLGKAEELLTALVPEGGGLAVKVTAELLQEISGIVGYEGEDPSELVEAVRSKVLTCYSCDVDDVLRRIADVIGYAGVRGDGLVEAVRALIVTPGTAPDCATCANLLAATQNIAALTDRRDYLSELLTKERAKLTLAQQSRDEWESRAVPAEANVQDQAAELNADDSDLREQLKVARELNDRLRSRGQESESRLIWYREALAVLRARLGLDHLGEDEDVVERMLEEIASVGRALTRFRDLATAADRRADEMEANLMEARSEINGLRDAVHGAASGQSALLDIALTALRGDALRGEAVAGLIDLARGVRP